MYTEKCYSFQCLFSMIYVRKDKKNIYTTDIINRYIHNMHYIWYNFGKINIQYEYASCL